MVITDKAPRPIGPYSQAIEVSNLVFTSGQIGIDPGTGGLAGGGIRAETARCLENIKAVLAASDLDLSDVVKITIFVTDLTSFKEVNEIYATYFANNPPARSILGVMALPLGANVEIEAIAVRGPRPSP